MQCANTKIPYGIWRLHVLRQVFGISQCLQPTRSFSTSKRQNKPQDETSISPSKRLPQSPFITHPRRLPGNTQDRKLAPEHDGPEPLAKNPWARALASPIRSCALSSARIPRDLMGEWGLVRRPNTEDLFILPVDLLKDSLKEGNSTDKDQGQSLDTATDQQVSGSGTASKKRFGRNLVFQMTNLISSLHALVEPLGYQRGRKPPVFRLVPFRWKYPQGPITKREESQMVWLDDMPQYLLKRMRRDLINRLVTACQKSHYLGAANGVWNVIEMESYSNSALSAGLEKLRPVENMECGAVILSGSPQAEMNQENDEGFPESVNLPQIQRGVPVFDLSELLSASELVELREAAPHFQHTALFFRPNNKVVMDLMMSLWKLKRYIAEDKELEHMIKLGIKVY